MKNIKLLNITYNKISEYLNNKYLFNRTNLNTKIKDKKKYLTIYCVDTFDESWQKQRIEKYLKIKYIINFTDNYPDYIIYNVFGNSHLDPKFNNSIKIAFLTENTIPDFYQADYLIGHHHINYIDRYFKIPMFMWYNIIQIKKIRDIIISQPIRKKFCAAVISNAFSTDGFRLYFINKLNKYKTVDMGGQIKNNVGGTIKDKIKFLSSYKFSISMENTKGDGYSSEKIIDSFLSGTIPIYYGNDMLDEYINKNSYILVKGHKDIKNKIRYIKKIDNNDDKYKKMLKENLLIDEKANEKVEKEEKEFLFNIFDQEKLKAFRKKE